MKRESQKSNHSPTTHHRNNNNHQHNPDANNNNNGDITSRSDTGSGRGLPKSMSSSVLSSTTYTLAHNYFPSSQNLPEPKSAYNPLSHRVLKLLPHEVVCKVGCRGVKCKYDCGDWPADQMVLRGLYSGWYLFSLSLSHTTTQHKLIQM